jgi:hypothetical protein
VFLFFKNNDCIHLEFQQASDTSPTSLKKRKICGTLGEILSEQRLDRVERKSVALWTAGKLIRGRTTPDKRKGELGFLVDSHNMLFLIILQTDSSECDVTYSPAFVCQHYLEKQTNWRKGAERKGKVNKCNWEGKTQSSTF